MRIQVSHELSGAYKTEHTEPPDTSREMASWRLQHAPETEREVSKRESGKAFNTGTTSSPASTPAPRLNKIPSHAPATRPLRAAPRRRGARS
jgi:hypothetical protein